MQGIKYDAPESVKDIRPFIEFHNLNMDEILDPLDSFKNFNEFIYRCACSHSHRIPRSSFSFVQETQIRRPAC